MVHHFLKLWDQICIWILLLPFEAIVVLYCQNQIGPECDGYIWKISYIIFFVCIRNNLNIILNFPCYCYVIFDTLKTVLRILWITKRMFISCYRLILPLRVNTIGHFLFLNHAMNALNYSNIHVYGMSRPDVYSPSTTSMYHRP